MKRPDIVWLIEHVDRELDVACIAKVLLAERYGISVEVMHLYLDVEAAGRRDAAVVVFPYFYQRFEKFHDAFLGRLMAKATVFCMAWEQIYYKSQEAIKAPRDDFARNHVRYLGWGDFFRDYLVEHGVEEKHVTVTGHPALQLYAEPYRRFFASRAELAARCGLDPCKRWIVIPENYRWAFRSRKVAVKAGKGSVDAQALLDMRQFCIDSLEELARWCQAAAATGDVEIILRPRPSTSVDRMETFVKGVVPERHSNFHILKSFSSREWILAADLVMSSVSTTLIEAAVAERPVAIAEPFPIVDMMTAEWQSLVPHLATQEAFIAACRGDTPLAESGRALGDWARARYLSHGDAYDRLTALLAAYVAEHRAVPTWRRANAALARPGILSAAYWMVLARLRRRPDFQLRRENLRRFYTKISGVPFAPIPFVAVNHDKDLFTPGDVAGRVAAWRKVIGARRGESVGLTVGAGEVRANS